MLTVVVVSLDHDSGRSPDLRSELSLIRSAALYADRVVLFSPFEPAASAEYAALQGKLDPQVLLDRLRRERPDLAARFPGPSGAGLLKGMVERAAGNHMPPMFRAADEILAGRRVGFVEPISGTAFDEAGSTDTEAFEAELVGLLADPTVHAVCDVRGAALLRRLTSQMGAGMGPAAVHRHRRAELGSGFIARLPAFPDAPLDELLDLKAGLKEPLARYRVAVGKLEADLALDEGGWQADEVLETLWGSTVEPALQEIEGSLLEHTLVHELARAASVSVRDLVLSGSALAVAVSTVGQVAASLAAATGLVAGAAHVAVTSAAERASRRREAARSDFYYLQQLRAALPAS